MSNEMSNEYAILAGAILMFGILSTTELQKENSLERNFHDHLTEVFDGFAEQFNEYNELSNRNKNKVELLYFSMIFKYENI